MDRRRERTSSMTLLLTSLILLALGAATALLLGGVPRAALRLSMLFALASSMLVVMASGDVLIRALPSAPYEVAWPMSLGTARLHLDGLSAWFLLTIGILATCVTIYTVPYMTETSGREPVPMFCALFCGLLASLVLLICAADVILFLVGWESMTLTAFFLVNFHHERVEVRRGAWMYLVATHLGTGLFVLPLFAILFARTGTTSFSSFVGAVGPDEATTLMVLFGLGLVGFGTKAGLMPMHIWLPAAHPVAPTPVSALLSGVVVKTGIYGLLRLLSWLPPLPPVCGVVLLLVAVVSGVMGVLYALAQHDLKSLLAYHTVENIGIMALGIAIGLLGEAANEPAVTVLGYGGALLHVANHALFKGLLFLSAGAVMHGSGVGTMDRLGGIARKMPMNATMFLIGAVAICGLPPLNGFLSEWFIYGSLLTGSIRGIGASGGLPAVGLAALALMGALALACFAKVYGVVFLGQPRDSCVRTHPTPIGMKVSMAILSLICILIGVLPVLWIPLAQLATAQVANAAPIDVTTRMGAVLSPLSSLSGMAALLLAVAGGLYGIREWLRTRATRRITEVAPVLATWGCGFARPAPRMQYTASSFASTLMTAFRSLLWPERTLVAPAGPFPSVAHVETNAQDMAQRELFEPLFRAIARLFVMVRTVARHDAPTAADPYEEERGRGPLSSFVEVMVFALRRGSIQVRLLFIVVTLAVLFLFEAISPIGRSREKTELHNPPALQLGIDR